MASRFEQHRRDLLDRFEQGSSLKTLASLQGITPGRVRQLLDLARRDREREKQRLERLAQLKNTRPETVDDLMLSVRASNVLMNANILTIDELLKTTVQSLWKVKNCGRRVIREIQNALEPYGLALSSLNSSLPRWLTSQKASWAEVKPLVERLYSIGEDKMAKCLVKKYGAHLDD